MRKKPATLKTKIQRQIRAVSPVISVLLMIAIAVAASLIAYAWVMGYMGGTTATTGKSIMIQSVANPSRTGTWLVIYVQNVGQGQIQLKQDISVYTNDVLHKITNSPLNNQTRVGDGELLPIPVGQTKELVIDYWYVPGTTLRIKVVTIEGTSMEYIIPGSETSEGINAPPGTQYTLTVNNVGSGSVTQSPYKTKYNPGDSVQLIPSTYSGWQFEHWSGDLSGSANPGNIIMNSNKSVTATFSQKGYELLISKDGEGTITKNPDKATYQLGDVVTLTATPAQNWFFAGWTGDVSSSSPSVALTIDETPQVTATFTQTQYSLTVTSNPPDGGSVDRDNLGPYTAGDVVVLTAHPAVGYVFAGWSGDLTVTDSPASITISGNMIVTANFAKTLVTLTLTANPQIGGTITPNILGPYHYGDTVQLTAATNAGYGFSGWSGDLSGIANPTWIALDGNKAVTANFGQNNYVLDVFVDGSGSVTKVPDQASYHLGDEVQLTAAAMQGWAFAGWTGDVTSSDTQITLTIDENPTVTATFTQAQYSLTITANPPNGGLVDLSSPGPTYLINTVLTLTPRPALGFRFVGWSGDLLGSDNPIQIVITGNMIVTADFEKIPVTLSLNVNPAGKGSIIASPAAPYYFGDVVELIANPVAGYSFGGWSGDLSGSVNPTSITLNDDKTVTADFVQKEYVLGISTVGSGTVTKSPNKATYHLGDAVQLTAAPAQGWTFAGWTGDVTSDSTQAEVTIDENPAVTATFTQAEYSLTLTVNPTNGGTVNRNPSGPTYHYNDVVTLNAIPATGYVFSSWSGDLTGTASSAEITITGNMIVTAAFTRITVTLTLNVNPAGAGSIITNSTSPYYYGDAVQLTPVPATGQLFNGWSGDLTGSSNPGTITLNGDKTVTANFVPNPSQTLLSTGFDGSTWDDGWQAGGNPPFFGANGEGIGGSRAAKSDSSTDGPFTTDPLDTSGGRVIRITFMYKVSNTEVGDLRLAYSKVTNPDLGGSSSDFIYVRSIGNPGNTGWNSGSLTIARTSTPEAITDPGAFVARFWFRFESSLNSGELVWIDNVVITVDY